MTTFNVELRTLNIALFSPQTIVGYGIVGIEVLGGILTGTARYPYSHAAPVWAPPGRDPDLAVTVDATGGNVATTGLVRQVREGASIAIYRAPGPVLTSIEELAARNWFRDNIGKTKYDWPMFFWQAVACPLGWRPGGAEGPVLRKRAVCSTFTGASWRAVKKTDLIKWIKDRYLIPSDFADPRTGLELLTTELAIVETQT